MIRNFKQDNSLNNTVKTILLIITGLFVSINAFAGQCSIACSFQKSDSYEPASQIDKIISEKLRQKGIKPANLCSDEVFIRRIYLDTIGTLPQAQQVRRFLENPRPGKRAALINILLKNPGFSDYWSLKWCDLLRVKSEFPINLWPNAVQAYHRWIHQSLNENMPYDQFARELLTTSGSNFRFPQVNFYRAIQGRKPSAITSAVALSFMGVRLEKWPETKRKDMERFFSRVAFKSTAEWKEEIVYLDPNPADSLKATFPDGSTVHIKSGRDPRKAFTDWLVTSENEWFSRNIVNRIWSWLLGRGIIHPADDIGGSNPVVYPEVLTYLEKKLIESKYDLREIYRLILNSSTYQQSSIPRTKHQNPEKLFACYPVRQLDAEVLIDALCRITGTRESYFSLIPEPFTFIPEDNRSIELADGSITSRLLEMFGRPSRDTGFESERSRTPTDAQRLHMLNSTHIQRKIEKSSRLKRLLKQTKYKPPEAAKILYLNILSRYPTKSEIAAIEEYFKTPGIKRHQAVTDLTWALINSKEFLFRH